MNKVFYFSAISFFNVLMVCAQVPPVGFAISYGGQNADQCWGVAVDGLGNTFTVGGFTDNTIIDNNTIVSNGNTDILIVKHNAQGNLVWSKNFGWQGSEVGLAVVADNVGNSYLSFTWVSQITVNGITYNAVSGSGELGVIKLNPSGDVIWFSTFGGSGTEYPHAVEVDADGNVYVAGTFAGDFTFNNQTVQTQGNGDVFVVKLNADGSHNWFSTFGNVFTDEAKGVAVDADNNCYIAGTLTGDATIGPLTLNAPGVVSNIFLVKYNSSGQPVWARDYGGENDEIVYGLSADALGNCYMGGTYSIATTIGNDLLEAEGSSLSDGFVAKFDNAGNPLWAKKIGSDDFDDVFAIANDPQGNIYCTGEFLADLTLENYTLINAGNRDAFVVKFDTNGNVEWADAIGGPGIDRGYGIDVHANGNCHVAGVFSQDLNIGTIPVINNLDYDVYLARYGNATITNINQQWLEQNRPPEVIGRFDLLGRPMLKNTSGIHVVLYNDGSRRKEVQLAP